MKIRIAIWATVGALVVVFWRIYIASTIGDPVLGNPLGAGGIGAALVCFTCPIALAGRHPMTFYQVLAVNAVTYALVGVVVETARRCCRVRSASN